MNRHRFRPPPRRNNLGLWVGLLIVAVILLITLVILPMFCVYDLYGLDSCKIPVDSNSDNSNKPTVKCVNGTIGSDKKCTCLPGFTGLACDTKTNEQPPEQNPEDALKALYKQAYTLYPNTFIITAGWYVLYRQCYKDPSLPASVVQICQDDNMARLAAYEYEDYTKGKITLQQLSDYMKEEVLTLIYSKLTPQEVASLKEKGIMDSSHMDFFETYYNYSFKIDTYTKIPLDLLKPMLGSFEVYKPEYGKLTWALPTLSQNAPGEGDYQVPPATRQAWDSVINRKPQEGDFEWMKRVFFAIVGGEPHPNDYIFDNYDSRYPTIDFSVVENQPKLTDPIMETMRLFLIGQINKRPSVLTNGTKISGLFNLTTQKFIGLPTLPAPVLPTPTDSVPTYWKDVAVFKIGMSYYKFMDTILSKFYGRTLDYPKEIWYQFFDVNYDVLPVWKTMIDSLPNRTINKSFITSIASVIISMFTMYLGLSLSGTKCSSITSLLPPACLQKIDYQNTPKCPMSCGGLSTDNCRNYGTNTGCTNDPNTGRYMCNPYVWDTKNTGCDWNFMYNSILKSGVFDASGNVIW